MDDLSGVPVQASIDATAVTGRLSTRKDKGGQSELRILYGLATREGAFQQTKINVESSEIHHLPYPEAVLLTNGMEAVCELIQQ